MHQNPQSPMPGLTQTSAQQQLHASQQSKLPKLSASTLEPPTPAAPTQSPKAELSSQSKTAAGQIQHKAAATEAVNLVRKESHVPVKSKVPTAPSSKNSHSTALAPTGGANGSGKGLRTFQRNLLAAEEQLFALAHTTISRKHQAKPRDEPLPLDHDNAVQASHSLFHKDLLRAKAELRALQFKLAKAKQDGIRTVHTLHATQAELETTRKGLANANINGARAASPLRRVDAQVAAERSCNLQLVHALSWAEIKLADLGKFVESGLTAQPDAVLCCAYKHA